MFGFKTHDDELEQFRHDIAGYFVDDLLVERDRMKGRSRFTDHLKILQELLELKTGLVAPPAEQVDEAPAPPPAIVAPSQFTRPTGDPNSTAPHVDAIKQAQGAAAPADDPDPQPEQPEPDIEPEPQRESPTIQPVGGFIGVVAGIQFSLPGRSEGQKLRHPATHEISRERDRQQ